jgi:hypothetical protein
MGNKKVHYSTQLWFYKVRDPVLKRDLSDLFDAPLSRAIRLSAYE